MLSQTWRLSLLVLCLFGGTSVSAWAGPLENADAAKALAYYERGDFVRAAAELENVVDIQLAPAEQRRTREALAISYYVLGRVLDARKQFSTLLRSDAAYEPDALYVAPEIVAFVADIRRGLAAEAAAQPATGAAEAVTASVRPAAVTRVEPVTNALFVAPPEFSAVDLLPFGAGQFRRGLIGRGTAFTVLESVFLGVNVGLYYYRRCELKACSAHYYPDGKITQAQHLQTIQVAAGSLFVLTAALGVADGLLLPSPMKTRLALGPVGNGVGLVWETD